MAKTWLNKFHCARKNQVSFGSAVEEETQQDSQIGSAIPMQEPRQIGDGTVSFPVEKSDMDPFWRIG